MVLSKILEAVRQGELRPSQVVGSEAEIIRASHLLRDRSGRRIVSGDEVAKAKRWLAEKCRRRHWGKLVANSKTYRAGSFDKYAIAVTSLTGAADSLARQQRAIESWKRFGLTVVAMQDKTEIKALRSAFPAVDQFIPTPKNGNRAGTKIPLITSLANVAVLLGKRIILINSDIEVYGTQKSLAEKIVGRKTQMVGIRFNYPDGQYEKAIREPYGLDVFSMTPAMAKTLPETPYCIGKPVWDYWIPCHFRSLGYKFNFIGEPMFFHARHAQKWSQEEWMEGGVWLMEHYGDTEFDWRTCVAFRQSFPYPPTTEAM